MVDNWVVGMVERWDIAKVGRTASFVVAWLVGWWVVLLAVEKVIF